MTVGANQVTLHNLGEYLLEIATKCIARYGELLLVLRQVIPIHAYRVKHPTAIGARSRLELSYKPLTALSTWIRTLPPSRLALYRFALLLALLTLARLLRR